MKWINASERLPDTKGYVFIRSLQTKHGGMVSCSELKNWDERPNLEWLDESEDETTSLKAENERLKALIEKAYSEGYYKAQDEFYYELSWNEFKKEHNL